jgi:hypothetical protein
VRTAGVLRSWLAGRRLPAVGLEVAVGVVGVVGVAEGKRAVPAVALSSGLRFPRRPRSRGERPHFVAHSEPRILGQLGDACDRRAFWRRYPECLWSALSRRWTQFAF